MADYLVDIMPKKLFASAAPTAPAAEMMQTAAEPDFDTEVDIDDGLDVSVDPAVAHQVFLAELNRLESDAELQAELAHYDTAAFQQEIDALHAAELATGSLVGDAQKIDSKQWQSWGVGNADQMVAHFNTKPLKAMAVLKNIVIKNGSKQLKDEILKDESLPFLKTKQDKTMTVKEGWNKVTRAQSSLTAAYASKYNAFSPAVDYLMKMRSEKMLKPLKGMGDADCTSCKMALTAAAIYTKLYYTFVKHDATVKNNTKPKYLSSAAVARVLRKKNKTTVDKVYEMIQKFGMDPETQKAMRDKALKAFIAHNHQGATSVYKEENRKTYQKRQAAGQAAPKQKKSNGWNGKKDWTKWKNDAAAKADFEKINDWVHHKKDKNGKVYDKPTLSGDRKMPRQAIVAHNAVAAGKNANKTQQETLEKWKHKITPYVRDRQNKQK